MSIADWINPFNKITDLASEAITDKDKLNELKYSLDELKQQVYLAELGTKTIPWVDGLHKMGRQIITFTSMIAGLAMIYVNPDIDPLVIAAILGPGGIYNGVKGRGK